MCKSFFLQIVFLIVIIFILPLPGCGDNDSKDTNSTDGGKDTEPPVWPGDLDIDCSAIPAGPFPSELLVEDDIFEFADDLAFDGQGYFALMDEENLVTVGPDGQWSLTPLDPVLEDRTKGVRYLPDGRLVVAWNLANRVMQVFPDGSMRTWLGAMGEPALVMPKQVYPDSEGNVWLTEFSYYKLGEELSTDKISRVSPDGTLEVIAKGGIAHEPKGILYDERRKAVFFVAGLGMEIILGRIDIDRNGQPGEPVEVYSTQGATGEGIVMDGCGNVYVVDAMFTVNKDDIARLLRIRLDPEGNLDGDPETAVEVVARFAGWINNMQFGSGPGFSPSTIYGTGFLETGVFSVDVGVPGAPVPVPDFTKTPEMPPLGPDEPIDLEFCEFEVTVNYTGTQQGWLSSNAFDEWPARKQELGAYQVENPTYPYTDILQIIKPYTDGDPVTVLVRLDTEALIEAPFAQPLLTGRSDLIPVDCGNPSKFEVTLQDSYGGCPGETGLTSGDANAACSGPGEMCLDLNDHSVNASLCASFCGVDSECPVATADSVTLAKCRPIGEKKYCVMPCTSTADCPNNGAVCELTLAEGICVFPNG